MRSFTHMVFTMLELLIVIGIIALLAAMLLPGLKRARDYAKSIQCNNNMKQYGLAFQMYANDYNGWAVSCQRSGDGGYWWTSLYNKERYFNNPRILVCPSTEAVSYIYSGYPRYGTNYKYNSLMGMSGVFDQIQLSRFKYPSRYTILMDSKVGVFSTYRYHLSSTEPHYENFDLSYDSALNQLDRRHNNGVNVLFVDGHAKWNRITCDAVTWNTMWRPQ